jgi:hypothetical protein
MITSFTAPSRHGADRAPKEGNRHLLQRPFDDSSHVADDQQGLSVSKNDRQDACLETKNKSKKADPCQHRRRLCEEDRADEAWGIAETLMERMPHSANPVILGSYVAWKMRKMPLAYQLGIRGTQMAPQEAIAFLNLGMGAQEIWLMDEAIDAYRMAERLAKDDKERGMALINLSAVYVDIGEYQRLRSTPGKL